MNMIVQQGETAFIECLNILTVIFKTNRLSSQLHYLLFLFIIFGIYYYILKITNKDVIITIK